MTEESEFGIWPPYEAFYIEAMLSCTKSASSSIRTINAFLEQVEEWPDDCVLNDEQTDTLLDEFQNVATQGAALSRYLWPSRDREPHRSRARILRESLEVEEDSPLRSRDLRNQMEHFDEKLDHYIREGIVGNIVPKYVGKYRGEPEVPTHMFRAYYVDTSTFEVLGRRYEMQPLVAEIARLHDQLESSAQSGYRLRSSDLRGQ